MSNTGEHTAVCRRIADIIRAANEKFAPEGVHPDTMGELIAGELGLRKETSYTAPPKPYKVGDEGGWEERFVGPWQRTC